MSRRSSYPVFYFIFQLCSCNVCLTLHSRMHFQSSVAGNKWKHVVLWNKATTALCCTMAKSMWLKQRCIMPEICASVLGVSLLWLKRGWAGAEQAQFHCHSSALLLRATCLPARILEAFGHLGGKILFFSTWITLADFVKYCWWREEFLVSSYLPCLCF